MKVEAGCKCTARFSTLFSTIRTLFRKNVAGYSRARLAAPGFGDFLDLD
jgi:hypothetical protein